jgi:hypothetical protein
MHRECIAGGSMADLEAWIEDSFVDVMDLCLRVIGHDETAKLSRVWAPIRDVAIAALSFEGLLGEGADTYHTEEAEERLRKACQYLVERLEQAAFEKGDPPPESKPAKDS